MTDSKKDSETNRERGSKVRTMAMSPVPMFVDYSSGSSMGDLLDFMAGKLSSIANGYRSIEHSTNYSMIRSLSEAVHSQEPSESPAFLSELSRASLEYSLISVPLLEDVIAGLQGMVEKVRARIPEEEKMTVFIDKEMADARAQKKEFDEIVGNKDIPARERLKQLAAHRLKWSK